MPKPYSRAHSRALLTRGRTRKEYQGVRIDGVRIWKCHLNQNLALAKPIKLQRLFAKLFQTVGHVLARARAVNSTDPGGHKVVGSTFVSGGAYTRVTAGWGCAFGAGGVSGA